ncbi:MAG: hypothetical protein ACI8PT_003965, partial [Gammaproteobacteria bacterium]
SSLPCEPLAKAEDPRKGRVAAKMRVGRCFVVNWFIAVLR